MKNYTEEEERYIFENYQKFSNAYLAKELNRSTDGIAQKLKEMGLVRRPINPYTEDEKKFIEDNIGKLTISEIASELNRTQGGVSKYISKFRVNKIRKKNKSAILNIDKNIIPFFSKSQNYYEILIEMEAGDSFEFPEKEKAVVSNQKYIVINEFKKMNKKLPIFMIRKTQIVDGIQYCRIWRLD